VSNNNSPSPSSLTNVTQVVTMVVAGVVVVAASADPDGSKMPHIILTILAAGILLLNAIDFYLRRRARQ
jgi:hypothetical protein